jgi:flagellum-specific peptidoglycan hydrolase FlgJ
MIKHVFIILVTWALRPKYWSKINPVLVIVQAYHESGNFSSNIFRENNNYFGMKEPSVRKTKATGTNRGHATFNSLWDSAKDLFLWFDMFSHVPKLTTMGAYTEFLRQKSYAEDPIYAQTMQSVYNSIRSKINRLKYVILVLLIPLPIIAVLLIKRIKKVS